MGLGLQKPDDEPGAAWVAIVIGIFVAYVSRMQSFGGMLMIPASEACSLDMTQAQFLVSC